VNKDFGFYVCRELIRVLGAYIHIYIYLYLPRPAHVVVWACVVCICVCVSVSWPFFSLILSLWVRIIFPREGRLRNLDRARENTKNDSFLEKRQRGEGPRISVVMDINNL